MLLTHVSSLRWEAPASTDLLDVRLEGDRIAEIGPSLTRRPGEAVVDLEGARLVPGLHDHHIHLRALAAIESSVIVGPPEVQTATELARRLRHAGARLGEGQWLRGVAYHQSVAGDLDRHSLDAFISDRPVRIQHASGVLWILNSRGLAELGITRDAPAGAERDELGELTGRFWREDAWLGSRLPRTSHDFTSLSQLAASRGIIGFTEATPDAGDDEVAAFAHALETDALVQRLHLMVEPTVERSPSALLTLGPTKILLDDQSLPTFDELSVMIERAHRVGRAVALHCVTRTQSVLSLAVLDAVGVRRGDRIEHGSILGPSEIETIARLGLIVVTQPGFVITRGDQFLRDVPEASRPDLWRLGSLLEAGITVAGSSDAPFGDANPWIGLKAAAFRSTLAGQPLGRGEALALEPAIGLYTSSGVDPSRQRSVAVGEIADLCAVVVGTAGYGVGPGPTITGTFVAGRLVYSAP